MIRARVRDAALGVRAPASLVERLGPPRRPGSAGYRWRQAELVSRALRSPGLLARFRDGSPLPDGWGVGIDERVVEVPWTLAQPLGGRMLDAGATLNHAHVLRNLLPRLESLTIATLEPNARDDDRYSYVLADLRDLPFEDGRFQWVASLSTLEHVGMDNTQYGVGEPRAEHPDTELRASLAELRRVLAPGGTMLVTVPYGRAEDHGSFRQLDRAGVELIVDSVRPRESEIAVFAYGRGGWQRSDLDAAASARFRDRPWPERVEDLATAARAVACLRLTC